MKSLGKLALLFLALLLTTLSAKSLEAQTPSEAVILKQFQRDKDWILRKIIGAPSPRPSVVETDFAFSTKGYFGRRILNGTPAVTLYWSDDVENLEDAGLTYDLNLKASHRDSDLMSRCLGSAKVEDMIDRTRGRLQTLFPRVNLNLLLNDLRGQLQRNHLMFKAAQENLDLGWTPSRVGVDYHFDSSAKLSPVGVGGGVSLRFVWSVDGTDTSCRGLVDQLLPKLDAVRIAEIVTQYSQALAGLDAYETDLGSLNLEGLRLSIGRTVGGSFIVGSLEAQKWGFIEFSRARESEKSSSANSSKGVENIVKGLRVALALSKRFVSAATQIDGAVVPQGVTTRFSSDTADNQALSLALIQTKASVALRFVRPRSSEKTSVTNHDAIAVRWRAATKVSFPWSLGVKLQPEITTVDLLTPE